MARELTTNDRPGSADGGGAEQECDYPIAEQSMDESTAASWPRRVLHPGEAKTDARDAAIIAETARTMPHTLRSIQVTDEQVAELTMLCGFDDDLAAQITQAGNRVRGLLTQIHPALERAIGPRLDHPAILDLLQRWPSPAELRAAGEKRITTRMLKLAPRKGRAWAHEIVVALGEQTVLVTGTQAAAVVIPRLAMQLATLRRQRDEVAAEVEKLVDAHPLQPVLTSMPGVGVRTAARLLTEVAGKHFPTAGHLAAYAIDSTRHPTIRILHPRRILITPREQDPQEHDVPLRVRRAPQPDLVPTSTARSRKESATTRRCWLSHGVAPTSCSRCCETAPFISPQVGDSWE